MGLRPLKPPRCVAVIRWNLPSGGASDGGGPYFSILSCTDLPEGTSASLPSGGLPLPRWRSSRSGFVRPPDLPRSGSTEIPPTGGSPWTSRSVGPSSFIRTSDSVVRLRLTPSSEVRKIRGKNGGPKNTKILAIFKFCKNIFFRAQKMAFLIINFLLQNERHGVKPYFVQKNEKSCFKTQFSEKPFFAQNLDLFSSKFGPPKIHQKMRAKNHFQN